MERKVDDRTILDKFVENFCKIVNKYVPYIICSGFVAIAHGRVRGTEDVDMIVSKMDKGQFVKMHSELIDKGFVCMQSNEPSVIFEDYLISGMSVRYVKKSEGFFPPEMELKFAKDELDEEQIKNRTKIPFTQLDIYFSSIESNIAFKEELLKSEKDLEDARHLRIIYEGKINEGEISEIKSKIRRFRLNER